MACIFYELAQNPAHISKLRQELVGTMEGEEADGSVNITNHKLQRLDHLNGIINETLRLHSPAGLALQRKTPPEGLMIGEVFVPGNITIWSPQIIIGKSELLSFLPSHSSYIYS